MAGPGGVGLGSGIDPVALARRAQGKRFSGTPDRGRVSDGPPTAANGDDDPFMAIANGTDGGDPYAAIAQGSAASDGTTPQGGALSHAGGAAVAAPDPGAEWDAAQRQQPDSAALGDEWTHAHAGDPGEEWERAHQQQVNTAAWGAEWDRAHQQQTDTTALGAEWDAAQRTRGTHQRFSDLRRDPGTVMPHPEAGDDNPYMAIAKGAGQPDDDPFMAIAKGTAGQQQEDADPFMAIARGTPPPGRFSQPAADQTPIEGIKAGGKDIAASVWPPQRIPGTLGRMVAGMASDAADALFTPVVGSPTATTPGHGGMMPTPAERTPVAPGAPGAITPEAQRAASGRTFLNEGLLLAPQFALPARAAINAGAGAALAPPGRRWEGATAGLLGGELFKGAADVGGEVAGQISRRFGAGRAVPAGATGSTPISSTSSLPESATDVQPATLGEAPASGSAVRGDGVPVQRRQPVEPPGVARAAVAAAPTPTAQPEAVGARPPRAPEAEPPAAVGAARQAPVAAPTAETAPTTDAESAARAADVAGISARDDQGKLRKNLSKVSTESIVDELRQMTTAQNADPSLGVRVVPDENFHTNASGVHVGEFRDSNRPAQRQKAIDRLWGELDARGQSPMDVAERWMELDAKTHEAGGVGGGDTDFDPANFRFSAGGVTPGLARKIGNVIKGAFVGPFEDVRTLHPNVAAAGERALAAPGYAQHLSTEQARWALQGEAPEALQLAMKQKTLDQLRAIRDGATVSPEEQAQLGIESGKPRVASQLRLGDYGQHPLDANIRRLEQEIPPNYSDSPDFQRINPKMQSLIDQLEQAARKAGVGRESMRVADHGYMRLAVADNGVQSTAAGAGRGVGTRRAQAAQRATGMGSYTDNPFRMLAVDAADKMPKAARNDFYAEVMKSGQPVPLKAKVPAGKAAVLIDNRGGGTTEMAAAKFKVIVDPSVAAAADHVEGVYNERPDLSDYGKFQRGRRDVLGTAALYANPKALYAHANYLANVAGTGPTGGPLRYLANAVPGGSSASGLQRILTHDRTLPENQELERQLMSAGGARPLDRETTQGFSGAVSRLRSVLTDKLGPLAKVVDAHDVVFGPNGIDIRARGVIAKDYRDAYRARTGDDPSWSETAKYVNQHVGSYVKGNAGKLVDFLQSSRLAQFARMSTARVGTAARTVALQSDLPGTALQRAGDIAKNVGRKVVLPAAGLEALNMLMSGHSTLANAPGHAFDLQTAPDDEKAGNTYALTRTLNPILGTVGSMGGEGAVRGDLRATRDEIANTALGIATSSPEARLAFGAGMGAQPYIEREGGLRTTPTTRTDAAGVLGQRFRNAAAGVTNLGSQFSDDPSRRPYGDTPAGRLTDYFLPAAVGHGRPVNADARLLRSDQRAALEGWSAKVRQHTGNPGAQEKDIRDAEADAAHSGLNPGPVRAHLERYAHMLNAGADPGLRRFQGQNPSTRP